MPTDLHRRHRARRLATVALTVAVLAGGGAVAAIAAPDARTGPADAHPSLRRCGAIAFSGFRTRIIVIRGTSCATARRVARAFDRSAAPAPWQCFIAHGVSRYRGFRVGFACGHPPRRGDIKRARHAFIGAIG